MPAGVFFPSVRQSFPSTVHRTLRHGLLLIALTCFAYAPVVANGYIWDDDAYVTRNPLLHEAGGLRRVWTEPTASPQYYPLVFTSFWLEARAWGLNPMASHLLNVLLHALSAVVLWRLLTDLGVPGAWWAAAVFGVHPVHVESVAWITERKNVLSGVFYLLAAWYFLHSELMSKDAQGPRLKAEVSAPTPLQPSALSAFRAQDTSAARIGCLGAFSILKSLVLGPWSLVHSLSLQPMQRYGLVIGLFVAVLLSKTVACTLPVALLIIAWWKRRPLRAAQIATIGIMLLLGLGFARLTASLERSVAGAEGPDWSFSMADRVLIAGRALWFYAAKLCWPARLMFVYPRWTINPGVWWQWLFPVAACGVMVGLWVLRRRLGRGPCAALGLFALILSPALGFVDFYPMRFSFVADHFQYLASIGLIGLLVTIATGAINASPTGRRLGSSLGVAVLVVLTAQTWQRVQVYETPERLWRDTLAQNPEAWLAHNHLSNLLADRGELAESRRHAEEAVRLKPEIGYLHDNLASVLLDAGKPDEALPHLLTALRILPTANVFNNLGVLAGRQHHDEDAIRYYAEALMRDPGHVRARRNLIQKLREQGRTEQAQALERTSEGQAP